MSLKINGGKKYEKRGRALALLLATVLTVSSVPGTVLAAEGIRPQDGTTKEQPFLSGTGGSSQFRIPCLVSLDDGTIVAGCDARWNTSGDGGGLDTIVSRSTDKGKTWHYTLQIISEITGMHGITIRQHLLILQWRQTEKEYI